MAKELLIVRHAKSDWDTHELKDFERPLKKRGVVEAQKMGKFLASNHLIPDYILCSTAKRARETAKLLVKAMGINTQDIIYDSDLYLCQPHVMIRFIENIPSLAERAMIVGHNPCLDFIVPLISKNSAPSRDDGKLMTTAAVAHIEVPFPWFPMAPHTCNLLNLWRPDDLA